MTDGGPIPAASFVLPLCDESARTPVSRPAGAARHVQALPAPLLARNARWFCRLRWLVIGTLAAFGVAGLSDPLMSHVGLRVPGVWPFAVAAVLLLSNVVFLTHARAVRRDPRAGPAKANLWGQIVVDLVVLTAVIHFVGSTQTYVAFTYLFHIALACVFLPRRESLLVTLLAGALYGACTLLEWRGVIPSGGMFAEGVLDGSPVSSAAGWSVTVGSAVAIWLVVWYLISKLSTLVRRRDIQLAETNERLLASLEERRRHMLVTTHELKAPFAAIHANAQLLSDGYCGDLPAQAMEVLQRITARCQRLTSEIQEMLQLANLTSTSQGMPDRTELDMAYLLQWAIAQSESRAMKRGVTIQSDLQPARVSGVEDHLKMMLGNLVTNAVIYSFEGGCVQVTCRTEDTGAVVRIADEGIGIDAQKLPRIFDEHFRTGRAAQHNRESSGLGLAIVRQVAQSHHVRLRVDSQPGSGTTFHLTFRPVGVASGEGPRGD